MLLWARDCCHSQSSTDINGVQHCQSSRPNWDSPTPSPERECVSPGTGGGGGGHTRQRLRGCGGRSQFGRQEKELCLLCAAMTIPRWCKIPHRMLDHHAAIRPRYSEQAHLTFFRNPLSVLECSAKMTELPLE
jgi:hypothetical protein